MDCILSSTELISLIHRTLERVVRCSNFRLSSFTFFKSRSAICQQQFRTHQRLANRNNTDTPVLTYGYKISLEILSSTVRPSAYIQADSVSLVIKESLVTGGWFYHLDTLDPSSASKNPQESMLKVRQWPSEYRVDGQESRDFHVSFYSSN